MGLWRHYLLDFSVHICIHTSVRESGWRHSQPIATVLQVCSLVNFMVCWVDEALQQSAFRHSPRISDLFKYYHVSVFIFCSCKPYIYLNTLGMLYCCFRQLAICNNFSYICTLTTWQCCICLQLHAAAIDWYLLPAWPTAANLGHRVCCCGLLLGQTDRYRVS